MIGDDIAAELPRLRAHAESMMRDRVVIRRKTGEQRDNETGMIVPTWEMVYTGRARVRMGSYAQPREGDQAGQRFIETGPVLSLPIGDVAASGVRLDDQAEVLEHSMDPLLVGTLMRVVQPVRQTFSTARRFTVEVVDHVEVPDG